MIEKILAAEIDLGPICGQPSEGFGPWGTLHLFRDVDIAAGYLTSILSKIIGIMTVIAGIWFFFILITGAFGYLTAGGVPKKILAAPYPKEGIYNPALNPLVGRGEGLDIINLFLGNIIAILLIVGVIVAFIFLVIGAIQWMTAGGDKAALELARGKVMSAIIGLIALFAA